MAAEIIVTLRGDKAQREAGYVQMLALARGEKTAEAIATAAAVIGPALESAWGAGASVVDAAEFQRASLVVCELFVLEPLQLIAESLRVGAVWATPGSAAEVLFDKDPAELTRDDAMTVACRWALYSCQYARGEGCATTSAQSTGSDLTRVSAAFAGNGATVDAVGGDFDTMVWMGNLSRSRLMLVVENSADDAFVERLCRLLLDIWRDPQGASQMVLAGVAMALGLGCSGRAQVSMSLIKAGMLEVAIELLQKSSPVDWATWSNWDVGPLACGIFTLGW